MQRSIFSRITHLLGRANLGFDLREHH
jgi:hypothetical protein